jgi:hypothetical protein
VGSARPGGPPDHGGEHGRVRPHADERRRARLEVGHDLGHLGVVVQVEIESKY